MTDSRLNPMTRRRPQRCSFGDPAFTLVELMVSIAMVLIIILGVNAIFKMASDTVNGGTAMSAAVRDARAAQTVLYDDLRTAVINDGPMLLIRSERVPAFRNAADEAADVDGNPLTQDFDNNNTEGEPNVPGELTPPLVFNNRNHRVDRLSFFSNHLYRRQTGTSSSSRTQFVDVGSSNEAYIWIGHLDQPDFKTPLTGSRGRFAHRGPGELPKDTNPNNYYATDWVLGRVVTLLREQPVPPGTPAAEAPNYFDDPDPSASPPTLVPLTPEGIAKERDSDGVRDRFSWSRYDIAQTSIGGFRQKLSTFITAAGTAAHDITPRDPSTWYELLGGEWGSGKNSARFQGYPYPDRPLTPYGVARTAPVFLRGCTQFIVEYAGDYLKQDPENGAIIGTYVDGTLGVDGVVDYMYVADIPFPGAAAQSVRKIRWYGMPRNVDPRDDANGPMILGGTSGSTKPNTLVDVVPLRDLLTAAGANIPENFFEHFEGIPGMGNYATRTGVETDPHKMRYYAAWSPDDLKSGSLTRPKMLRITMTIDDPDGRITEGQTFEFVIDLP